MLPPQEMGALVLQTNDKKEVRKMGKKKIKFFEDIFREDIKIKEEYYKKYKKDGVIPEDKKAKMYKKINANHKRMGCTSNILFNEYMRGYIDDKDDVVIIDDIFESDVENINYTLDNANIKKVYLAEQSTALMRILHQFYNKGWNISPRKITNKYLGTLLAIKLTKNTRNKQ